MLVMGFVVAVVVLISTEEDEVFLATIVVDGMVDSIVGCVGIIDDVVTFNVTVVFWRIVVVWTVATVGIKVVLIKVIGPDFTVVTETNSVEDVEGIPVLIVTNSWSSFLSSTENTLNNMDWY